MDTPPVDAQLNALNKGENTARRIGSKTESSGLFGDAGSFKNPRFVGTGITADTFIATFQSDSKTAVPVGLGEGRNLSPIVAELFPPTPGLWIEQPRQGELVAIKISHGSTQQNGVLNSERGILTRVNSLFSNADSARPVRLLGYGVDQNQASYHVLEAISGNFKLLENYILQKGKLDHLDVLEIASGVGGILAKLHTDGITHMDMSSEAIGQNVFFDPNTRQIRVIDFGNARYTKFLAEGLGSPISYSYDREGLINFIYQQYTGERLESKKLYERTQKGKDWENVPRSIQKLLEKYLWDKDVGLSADNAKKPQITQALAGDLRDLLVQEKPAAAVAAVSAVPVVEAQSLVAVRSALHEQAIGDYAFSRGDMVWVERSDRRKDDGWVITGFNPQTGDAIVLKNENGMDKQREISRADLNRLNQLPKPNQPDVVSSHTLAQFYQAIDTAELPQGFDRRAIKDMVTIILDQGDLRLIETIPDVLGLQEKIINFLHAERIKKSLGLPSSQREVANERQRFIASPGDLVTVKRRNGQMQPDWIVAQILENGQLLLQRIYPEADGTFLERRTYQSEIMTPRFDQRNPTVAAAKNFAELEVAIRVTGGIQGSRQFYTVEDVIGLMNAAIADRKKLEKVTNTGGLRQKLGLLLDARDFQSGKLGGK